VTREVKFLSSDYPNPNTNPNNLTTLTLTLTYPHGTFESFCSPVSHNNFSPVLTGPGGN